jgi:pimeloyl-ACP methyl ester carboxylesterase
LEDAIRVTGEPKFPEKLFDTGQVMINYAEGPVRGPPVLMLHGTTRIWRDFTGLMARLSPEWHVNACDLRGHGKSGRDDGQFRLNDYVRDTVAFLSRFTQPAVLIGHSLGALTALVTAAAAPKSTRAVILLDPPLFLRSLPGDVCAWIKEFFQWVYETIRLRPTYDQVVAACRARDPEGGEAEISELAERVFNVEPEAVRVTLQSRLLEECDLEQAVKDLSCPTLLLRGEWECQAVMRDEDAEWFQGICPAARVEQVLKGSHGFLWEETEVTTKLIEEFLRTIG